MTISRIDLIVSETQLAYMGKGKFVFATGDASIAFRSLHLSEHQGLYLDGNLVAIYSDSQANEILDFYESSLDLFYEERKQIDLVLKQA